MADFKHAGSRFHTQPIAHSHIFVPVGSMHTRKNTLAASLDARHFLRLYGIPILCFLVGFMVSVPAVSVFYEKGADLTVPVFFVTGGQKRGLPDGTIESAVIGGAPSMDSIVVPKEVKPTTFVLYELYYSEAGWPHLHSSEPYKPVCLGVGEKRPQSSDIEAPILSPALRNETWQKLICEYGGILTVSSHFERLQRGSKWLGFQSWKAAQKNSSLSQNAIQVMEANMRERESSGLVGVMYYWSNSIFDDHSFWDQCEKYHFHCRKTISHVCQALFEDPPTPIAAVPDHKMATIVEKFVPPMPYQRGDLQPVYSYWAMHETRFKQFCTFAKMFLTVLEATFPVRKSLDNCPLVFDGPPYSPSMCWCFVMERIVNIWAQHAGIRMLHVNVDDGTITEKRQLSEEEQSYRWQQYFSEKNLNDLSQIFRARLDKEALEIYDGFHTMT